MGEVAFEAFGDGPGDDGVSWPPTCIEFSNALQLWAFCQNGRDVTTGEAALAFNVPVALIEEAVESHYWMFLGGEKGDLIEHAGV